MSRERTIGSLFFLFDLCIIQNVLHNENRKKKKNIFFLFLFPSFFFLKKIISEIFSLFHKKRKKESIFSSMFIREKVFSFFKMIKKLFDKKVFLFHPSFFKRKIDVMYTSIFVDNFFQKNIFLKKLSGNFNGNFFLSPFINPFHIFKIDIHASATHGISKIIMPIGVVNINMRIET